MAEKKNGSGLTFYRCLLCARVVSAWDIRDHGRCRNCYGTKIRPTNLTLREKLKQVLKHPLVWEWEKHELVSANQAGQKNIPQDVGSDTDTVQRP